MADQLKMVDRGAPVSGAARLGERLWLVGELLTSPALEIDGALPATASACDGWETGAVPDRLDAAAMTLFDCEAHDSQAGTEPLARVLADTVGLLPDGTDA